MCHYSSRHDDHRKYAFPTLRRWERNQTMMRRGISVHALHSPFPPPLLGQTEAKDVGKIFKIRISHDGKGMGAGWFLETVDVKRLIMAMVSVPKKKEEKKEKKKKKKKKEEEEEEEMEERLQPVVLSYHFPCSRWLAAGEEDGELVVELLPEDAEELEGRGHEGSRICGQIAERFYRMLLSLGPMVPPQGAGYLQKK